MAVPVTVTPTGLTANSATTYFWRVRAVSPAGSTSAFSTVQSFTIDRAPNAPTLSGPSGTTLVTTNTLSWTFSDPDAGDTQSGWAVRASVNAGVTYLYWNASTLAFQSTEVINTGAVLSLAVTNVVGPFQWSAKVADSIGTLSAYATDAAYTIGSGSVPGAPTGVSATAFDTSALVGWSAPVSTGGSAIIDYTITSSPGGFTAVYVVANNINGLLLANVRSLTNATSYTFTVTARNSTGSSAASLASIGVTPTHVQAPSVPRTIVEVAFANNQTTASANCTWTDISHYVTGTIHTSSGRQHETTEVEAGKASLRLVNLDGRFNPFNSASPYFGPFTDGTDFAVQGLVPMKRIRIRSVWNGATYNVWHGFIDAWPMVWANEVTAYVDITATDAFKQLNLAVYKTVYDLTILGTSPTGWWRLGDPVGQTVAVESSGAGINGIYANAGTNATNLLQGQVALNASDSTTSIFIPEFVLNDYMVVSQDKTTNTTLPIGVGAIFTTNWAPTWSGGNFTWSGIIARKPVTTTTNFCSLFAMIFQTPAGPVGANCVLLGSQGGTPGAPGALSFTMSGAVNSGPSAAVTNRTVADNAIHHIAVTWVASTGTATIYIDGVQSASAAGMAVPVINSNYVFPLVIGQGFGGFIQDVAIWNNKVLTAAQISDQATAALTAWAGDVSGARIIRLLRAISWPVSDQIIEPGLSVLQAATLGKSTLGEAQSVADTERGILFLGPDGAMRYYGRSHWVSTATSTSSQVALGEGVEPYELNGTTIGMDDLDIWNDIQVTRNKGTLQRAEDFTSQTRYGVRTLAITNGLQQNEADALSTAQYLLDRFRNPVMRVAAVTIHPLDDAPNLYPQVLGLGLADRITVTRDAPGTGVNYTQQASIEMVEHTIDVLGDWHTVWRLSPADTTQYCILDSAAFALLNSTARLFM